MKKLTIILSLLLFFSPSLAYAFDGDLSINTADITFSSNNFMEGKTVRIYAQAQNNSSKDLLGVVRFMANGKQIGGDQAISVFAGKADGVFIDWSPAKGQQEVTVRISPWEPAIDNPANNSINTSVFVAPDLDRDGITDDKDPDLDGDSVANAEDHFPRNPKESLDTDGDGIGNNSDDDDDNDKVPDKVDEMPLDPNESIDSDKDGIGNNKDTDDDGDNLADNEEDTIGTAPLNPDTDGDKALDGQDDFPLDPAEQLDTDTDGIGNNIDTDDDNDGLLDDEDDFPLNKPPTIELKEVFTNIDLLDKKTFDASPSYDEDGDIVLYEWDVDGKIYEGNAITHIFNKLGKSEIQLRVTDQAGQSITKSFQVNVINLQYYKVLIATLLTILLAIVLYLKYIREAKNSHK